MKQLAVGRRQGSIFPAAPGTGPDLFESVRAAIGRVSRAKNSGFIDIEEADALRKAQALSFQPADNGHFGGLEGVLYARKDCFAREGKAVECGSGSRAGRSASETAPIVRRLDEVGAIDLGRLHMAELAMSPMGRNDHLGPGRNPWDTTRVSGGSSSGSAVAVSQRLVHFALGTDTGGSVRLPAAACGITGYKPTNGVLPTDLVMPLAPTLDTVGLLAPSAAEVSYVLQLLLRNTPGAELLAMDEDDDSTTTIVAPTINVGPVTDEAVVSRFEAMVREYEAMGFRIRRIEAPDLDLLNRLAMVVMCAESAACFETELRQNADAFTPEIRRRLERGLVCPAPVYYRALRARKKLLAEFLDTWLPERSVLLLPTIPSEAPPIHPEGSGAAEDAERRYMNFSYWARPINYLGVPALSVPIGLGESGLPVGAQIIGRPFEDLRVLNLAESYQEQTGWHTLLPPETSNARNNPRPMA